MLDQSRCFIISLVIHQSICVFDAALDLGYGLDGTTVYWDDGNALNLNISFGKDPYYAAGRFTTEEHGGTHIDAPYHFWQEGWKVADIPLQHLIASGVLCDVSKKVGQNHSFQLTDTDLEEWARENEIFENDEKKILLIRFGWSGKYLNRTDYLGIGLNPDRKTRAFPGIGGSGARWIVQKGSIVGVGIDVASVDHGGSTDFIAHKTFSAKNIFNLENVNLTNQELPTKGFSIIAMPIKLTNGTGGPVRVIAMPQPFRKNSPNCKN